jgi:hypothetical protein
MADHWIRLRGGWEWHDPEAGSVRRLTLPRAGPVDHTAPLLLVRAFHRPTRLGPSASLFLSLQNVAGLLSVALNGRELARPSPGTTAVWLPIDQPLPARNLLSLEVDPNGIPDGDQSGSLWGSIALVIREPDEGGNYRAADD